MRRRGRRWRLLEVAREAAVEISVTTNAFPHTPQQENSVVLRSASYYSSRSKQVSISWKSFKETERTGRRRRAATGCSRPVAPTTFPSSVARGWGGVGSVYTLPPILWPWYVVGLPCCPHRSLCVDPLMEFIHNNKNNNWFVLVDNLVL